MIVADSNVISELMRPPENRAPEVVAWFRSISGAAIYTTAISMAEILSGLAALPEGRRRREKLEAAEHIFDMLFAERLLPFDESAARTYAVIYSDLRRRGLGIDPPDLQIAAISRTHGMALATRNVRHFQGCGIDVINPWQPDP